MRFRISAIFAAALLCLAPTVAQADLAPYSQDLEGLDQMDGGALAGDGWLVFANVFGPDWNLWYNYGPFAAPNGGPGFSGIDLGQGGPAQGAQQLVVYNDYNNGNHGDGSNAIIEANVFQEQIVGAADAGQTWRFAFDAKRGNIEPDSMAGAFIKTLDPASGFALTNFIQNPMTDIPDAWGSYLIEIYIDPSLEGQILQFGFINWASNFEGSGIFYDNINFGLAPLTVGVDVRPEGCPNPLQARSRGVLPVAVVGSADFDVNSIDVSSLQLEGVTPIRWDYEDEAGPYEGDLCGCTEEGADGLTDLMLKFDTQALVAAIGATSRGQLVLTLTGALLDGTSIEGQDCVILVGRSLRPIVGDRPSIGTNSTHDPSRKGNVRRPTTQKSRAGEQ